MKVTLKQPHTHAGQKKQAGDEIDVTPAQAEWLAAQGVVSLPPEAAKAAGKTK